MFLLGMGAMALLVLVLVLWLIWPAITVTLRRSGWTWRELRRPIAFDGPWTDGWWRTSAATFLSATGRRLWSRGNNVLVTTASGSSVPAWPLWRYR